MNRQFFDELNEEEKYIFAQSMLNPIMRLGIAKQIRQLNDELVNLKPPSEWSYEKLVTFTQRFQRRQQLRDTYLGMLEMLDEAQAYIKHLQQMET